MKRVFLKSLVTVTLLITALNAADASLEDKITSLYISYFDRAADYDGLNYWKVHGEAYINEGKSEYDALRELSTGFASVPTFLDMYSSMSNEDFVKAFYRNVLGREGDAGGIVYWTAKLDSGESRSDMVVEYMDIVLAFDPADYPSLSQSDLDAAIEAQTVILNKIAVAEAFTNTLMTATNVLDSQHPENDPAYLASLKVLEGVGVDQASVDEAIGKIYAQRNESADDAIYTINNFWEYITPDYSFITNLEGIDTATFITIVNHTSESGWDSFGVTSGIYLSAFLDEATSCTDYGFTTADITDHTVVQGIDTIYYSHELRTCIEMDLSASANAGDKNGIFYASAQSY